jgi:phytoene synthase
LSEAEPQSQDLDALVRRVDPDRWLSSRFVGDAARRQDVIAIYAYDYELARAPKVASNALLGEIRLTWWREALDEVFEGRPVRQHPGVQALARAIRRRDLPREALEAMNDARYRDLDPTPMSEAEALEWARDTAGRAAELVAHILDPTTLADRAAAAGAAWAMGMRFGEDETRHAAFRHLLATGQREVRGLSIAAFPAVAHVALAGRPAMSELGKRLRITWAVARGRI